METFLFAEDDCDSDSSMSYCGDDHLGSRNSSLNLSAHEDAEKSDDF